MARSLVEVESVGEFMKTLEWCKKATENGKKLFTSVEMLGSFNICGGLVGLLGK